MCSNTEAPSATLTATSNPFYPHLSPPCTSPHPQANSSLTLVSSTVACAPVYGVYASTLSALCGEGIVASIKTWGLATAACVLVYILVSAGARLCWSHPGDALDPVDENKPGEAAVAPAGAHRGQYVMPATGAAPQLMYAAPVARHGAGGAAQYA